MAKKDKDPIKDADAVSTRVAIKTKNRKPYRRCGHAFGERPVEMPMTAFTPDEMEALYNDANLVVDLIGEAAGGQE